MPPKRKAEAANGDQDAGGAPKKRGRPPKNPSASPAAPPPAPSSDSEQPKKRGRGRPPKNPDAPKPQKPQKEAKPADAAPPSATAADDAGEGEAKKRGRGRPKKNAEAGSSSSAQPNASAAPPRRGRPPKNAAKAAPAGADAGGNDEQGAGGDDEEAAADDEADAKDDGENVSPQVVVNTVMPKVYSFAPVAAGSMKLVSWNVAGLTAALKKGFTEYVAAENADILCLQETKLNETPNVVSKQSYPFQYWHHCTAKKGYAGSAVLSKTRALNVTYGVGDKEFDTEGRTITLEFEDFHLVACYIPNAGAGLKRLSDKQNFNLLLETHLHKLNETKPVIWTGDLNVAHQEIDLTNPKTNQKNAGFTKEERSDFTRMLAGPPKLVDTWRSLNGNKVGYSYWSYRQNCRAKNIGWRLDYFVVSEPFMKSVQDSFIRTEAYGASDHVPIGITIASKR